MTRPSALPRSLADRRFTTNHAAAGGLSSVAYWSGGQGHVRI